MRKLSKAKESKRLGDRKRICSLGLIMLLLGLSIAVLNSAIVAAQLPSPSEEAFNQSLIYRNFKFEHQLLGVGVYDAKWEQFLYGDQLEAELSVPSVSRLVLLSLVAERFNQDDLIFISSSAAVADRNLAAQSPDNILLSGGQQFSVEYLVYRMLFYHSDGAAVALLEALAANAGDGIRLLNQQAEIMGLTRTKISSIRLHSHSNDITDTPMPQNTTTITDLIKIMLSYRNMPKVQAWLSTYETFLTVNFDGQRLLSLRSPIYRLWSLSEGQVNQAFNAQDSSSLTLTAGTTKEGHTIITASVAANKSNMIQDVLRLYSAIDNYYEETPLVSKGEKMAGLKERAENGDVFDLVYLETINYLHPEDDLFLTQDIEYQGNPPYLLPLTAGTITGKAVFSLKNGMKISANVGPDRDILSSRSQVALFLRNLSANLNLARLLLFLVILLILFLSFALLRNLLRIFYYWRAIRGSKRHN
ncbi:MAG: hypothetical protein ACOX3P_05745 [Saccharofermentanales bacterium]|jgi:D-alanyl-D-alanine carboxypeptidase|nr:hypothetical protein [Bacillota bacterium]NLB08102.1 hypothetical protein [Clostridiales bacterium]